MDASSDAGFSLWLRLARQPKVVKRALKFGVGVGAILIAINHGDAIVNGTVDKASFFKMALTVMVPYLVSTASSVGAQIEAMKGQI